MSPALLAGAAPTMLEYDNSAFYYFMISLLAIYMVPGWILMARHVWRCYFPEAASTESARSSLEEKKQEKLKLNKGGASRVWNTCFVANLMALLCVTLIFVYLIIQVSSDSELAHFDPFKILGVDPGATEKQIKRAYRIKSLEYHPDKNKNDKNAEQMFMMVAKAHQALTDEEARENWEKYGNPDGRQALEISIGLPSFFLDTDYHNMILIFYLVCLVVVIPAIVGLWYSHSRQFGENNVMYDSYRFFQALLTETSHIKSIPEVFSIAAEFQKVNKVSSEGDLQSIRALAKSFQDKKLFKETFMAKPHPKLEQPHLIHIQKGNVIIHAHLGRALLEEKGIKIPGDWAKNSEIMLTHTSSLIGAMLEVCISSRWTQTALTVMQFSQYLTQAVWPRGGIRERDAPYLQLPHLTTRELKHMKKSFAEYLREGPDERRGLSEMDDKMRADVHRVCSIIPDVDVQVRAYVEDEEEIAEKDLVTLEVALTRNNVAEGKKAEPVHSPLLPVEKEEGWWVMLVEVSRNHLVTVEKITSQEREVKHELKFLAPPQHGTFQFKVFVISDSYLGLDKEIPFEMKVIPADELPEFEPPKEEEEEEIQEMSLFEGTIGASNVDSDVSEDEEDEPDAGAARGGSPKPQPAGTAGSPSAARRNPGGMTDSELRRRQKRMAKKQGNKSEGNSEDAS